MTDAEAEAYKKQFGDFDLVVGEFGIKRLPELIESANKDVTVHRMVQCGVAPTAIIAQLISEKESLLNRLMALEAIAPKKIIMLDGSELVYRCPIELIPAERVIDLRKTNDAPAAPR